MRWKSAGPAASLGLALLLSGCKAREMGVQFSRVQAKSVNSTWLIAANSCWPDLSHQGYTVADMTNYLADPLHFRATFAAYGSLSDEQLLRIIPKPVGDAPAPDTSVLNHTSNPVLTRTDAVTRRNLGGMLPANNSGLAPADALCAIQSGLPVGFR